MSVVKLSDKELLAESGKTLKQWIAALDTKDCNLLSNDQLIEHLMNEHKLDEACAEFVASCYKPSVTDDVDGELITQFNIAVSKTFDHPVSQVYDRAVDWFETETRAKMQDHINKKRLKCKWLSDNSNIDVKFQSKGRSKTMMVLEHDKLECETDADIMKNFWSEHIPKMIESL